ncbi:amidohydrolase [Parasphingopyxis lamellibrachiae]|uniref:Hippurate hydrolase n=1 Tax=Parasphingopyxis lamellibrachiae TaxID=680125 RepID=A0A3D9FH36_9SPHN|nr:amidohydrolase [Parasphingopyxis lamellibrachiae]RED16887.1 hippurate hydrolase [Parasphingopyxis lamellibrachiae]
MRTSLIALAATFLLSAPAVAQSDIAADVEADYSAFLEELFLDFHRNPELSYMETRTAGIIAAQLREAGAEVTEGVGGTGVVGVMRNGEGPTVLVRADMDGLPLVEASGLDYASTARQTGIDGVESNVMHACGHDVHITSLIGAARQLAARRHSWNGTILFVAQPAEERIGGARAMMEDGLYSRFPKPEYALAFHVSSGQPTGTIAMQPGLVASSSDSVDITIHGVGAHGAYPHAGIDPIVMGAEIIMALQTLVSRTVSPLDPAVVTVGAFQGGIKHNIISDRATMQLTVRSNDQAVRETLLEGIARIAENVGRMNGMPEDRLPEVEVSTESTPPTINDADLADRLRGVFVGSLGEAVVLPPTEQTGMGAEDFAYFVQPDTGVRGAYFSVGGTPQAAFDAAEAGGLPVPSHHSPLFRVDPEPSVRLGTEAMVIAVLDLLAPMSGESDD